MEGKVQTSIIQKIEINGNTINISVNNTGIRLSTKRQIGKYNVTMRKLVNFEDFIKEVDEQEKMDIKSGDYNK